MQVELIRWLDTGLAIAEGWKTPDWYASQAATRRMEVLSVGFLVHEDDDVIVLAQSYDPEHNQYVNAEVIAKQGIITRGTPMFDGDIRLLAQMPSLVAA